MCSFTHYLLLFFIFRYLNVALNRNQKNWKEKQNSYLFTTPWCVTTVQDRYLLFTIKLRWSTVCCMFIPCNRNRLKIETWKVKLFNNFIKQLFILQTPRLASVPKLPLIIIIITLLGKYSADSYRLPLVTKLPLIIIIIGIWLRVLIIAYL